MTVPRPAAQAPASPSDPASSANARRSGVSEPRRTQNRPRSTAKSGKEARAQQQADKAAAHPGAATSLVHSTQQVSGTMLGTLNRLSRIQRASPCASAQYSRSASSLARRGDDHLCIHGWRLLLRPWLPAIVFALARRRRPSRLPCPGSHRRCPRHEYGANAGQAQSLAPSLCVQLGSDSRISKTPFSGPAAPLGFPSAPPGCHLAGVLPLRQRLPPCLPLAASKAHLRAPRTHRAAATAIRGHPHRMRAK